MPDMLVSLVRLPRMDSLLQRLREKGISLRRPNPWEMTQLREFIERNFSTGWADEATVAFANKPVSAFIATHEGRIVGFAAYECTRRNFFGPMGVLEAYRGNGIGTALLLASLYAMQDMGYVYAIIGGAGPVDFYAKVAGAVPIPFDEGRGIYGLAEDPRFATD
jgi:GNAT superfamily N-acetyltransferase